MSPALSKQALGEVTNSSNRQNSAWLANCRYKTTSSRLPPRAPRTSLIPSTKPFSKSSSVKLKKANGCATATSSDTSHEASLSGAATVASTLLVVKNETAKESPKQKLQQLKEDNFHLKIDKFNLLKELHHAYSMFVMTGYRCTYLESENKQLRQDQESLRQELLALKTKKINDTEKMMQSSHDENDENKETNKTLLCD